MNPGSIRSEFPFWRRSLQEKNFFEPDAFCLLAFRV